MSLRLSGSRKALLLRDLVLYNIKMKPCVYILLLESGQYYIGSTSDLLRRLREHSLGKTSGIRYSKNVKLVFNQEFETLQMARNIEYRLKRFKSRKIIEKIISDGEIKLNMGP